MTKTGKAQSIHEQLSPGILLVVLSTCIVESSKQQLVYWTSHCIRLRHVLCVFFRIIFLKNEGND